MLDIYKSLNDQFLTFLNRLDKEIINSKILLAFSGGVDSVALALFFIHNKIDFSIAHMNFQLRGEESLKDEEFVKEFAKKYNIDCYTKKVDTNNLVQTTGKSTQMIARELRYDWFDELINQSNYNFLATAHHLSDHVETIIFNLTKGTGIEGLHGILPIRGNVIRPLRFMNKEQIVQFVEGLNIKWREDQSNSSTKYARNKIRHKVIPLLKEINPSVEKAFDHTSKILKQIEYLFFNELQNFNNKYIIEGDDESLIRLKEIGQDELILLYYYLKQFGFDYSLVENIFGKKEQPSLEFSSKKKEYTFHTTHKEAILIKNKVVETNESEIILLPDDNSASFKNHSFLLKEKTIASFDELKSNDSVLVPIDYFPLKVRNVKKGDKIRPFGMKKGKKKVFDLLQDEGIPKYLREGIVVLLSNEDEILNVFGIRNSESLRITNFPCKLIEISMIKPE